MCDYTFKPERFYKESKKSQEIQQRGAQGLPFNCRLAFLAGLRLCQREDAKPFGCQNQPEEVNEARLRVTWK